MTVTEPKLHPVTEAGIAAARERVSMGEMLNLAREVAARIERVQKILMDDGTRKQPDPRQIRNMTILDSMVRYFEREMRRA